MGLTLKSPAAKPMIFHGVARFVSGWVDFADQMVQSFHTTFLPDFLVRPFALSVPPVEAVLGTMLCLGLLTRPALIGPRSAFNLSTPSSYSCCKCVSRPTASHWTPS
jgi:hypothetical protein